MHNNVFVFILLLSSLVAAQTKTASVDDLKRIQQAALKSDYAYEFAAHLTDSIGPRLSDRRNTMPQPNGSRRNSAASVLK